MILFQKNSIHLNSKAFLALLFVLLFSLKTFGQEFDWVYTSKAVVGQNDYPPRSYVKAIATNSNNDVYAVGAHSSGLSDFGDGQEEIYFNTGTITSGFLVKLDENKNIQWFKSWWLGGYYNFYSITLDDDGNIYICGDVHPTSSSLYFDPKPPNPIFPNIFVPTHTNLSNIQTYGFILKLDPEGNYINAILFDNTIFVDIEKDHNNEIIVVGGSVDYIKFNLWSYLQDTFEWGYIIKIDNNLNVIWDKKFNSQSTVSRNFLSNIEIDSQNNIFCTGFYHHSFNFNNTTLQHDPTSTNNSKFLFKLLPNGNENWIVDLHDNTYPYTFVDLIIDASDTIYFYAINNDETSIQFANSAVSNSPLGSWQYTVLFKADTNGNHIWNVPIYGSTIQKLTSFTVNSLGEVILPIRIGILNELYYVDQTTTIEADTSTDLLLKINSTGELIDYKRLFKITEQDAAYNYNNFAVNIDSDDNILLGGGFRVKTDFDPHPFREYNLSTDIFQFGDLNRFNNETRAYVLKLTNCDIVPLFEDTYEFCSGTTPNPVIADIKPKALNVKWYSSMVSSTPLGDDFEVIDGQTYFYENIVENCPNFERLPVIMTIFVPPPPVFNTLQPCYVEDLMLSDLSIEGQNITFYDSIDGDSIPSSTAIIPETTYYVSQTINECESEPIPIIISDLLGSSLNQHKIVFCIEDEEDIFENVNLSDYNNFFLPSGVLLSDFDFSYHNSYDDANGNLNPITNYQNYQVTNQTIFIRIYSEQNSCYKITELVIQFSTPPTIENIITEDWTDSNNTITVLPNDENFWYSLDGITYQNSNYFENIAAGEYNIYIKNEANCVGIAEKIYLLNYPKFFTPNGDGVNDNWKVKFSEFQELFQVEIYDRYGKFIKSFDKNSVGWDGKHNGINLPTSDYWFKIIRVSDKEIIHRGHFSLKR